MLRVAFALPLIASAVLAQDKPQDPQAAARAAYAELMAAMGASRSVQDPAKREELRRAIKAAQERFRVEFAKSDWDKWDPQADRNLLCQGLVWTGQRALEDKDGRTALKAFETFDAKLPDLAGQCVGQQASAHALVSGFEKALAFVQKAAESADAAQRPVVLTLLGDYKAASGDVAGARKEWESAVAPVPPGAEERNAFRAQAAANLRNAVAASVAVKLALVGNDAPEIAAKTWLDGEKKPLSALKGSVVVVDFWATWCPQSRQVMPSLDALYREKKGAGLIVLGVTRFYDRGFMPKAGTKDPQRDGEAVDGISEETFLDHVKQFKANLGLSYPFAIATDAEFGAYQVKGPPTLAVVGRDGKIAFLSVGTVDETLLKAAVDHALSAKS